MQNYRNGYRQQNNQSCIPVQPPMPCYGNDDVLDGMPIAMAYVPWQSWQEIYPPEKALSCGTIFRELNKPFLGRGGVKR